MTIFKCKMCGGDMTVDRSTGIAVCDYCGTKQTLPQFTDESSELLYNRGTSYLMQNEFDKAENIFNQLLSINPQDAEIYWDLVMCRYGVTFVKDSKSGQYIPTCNRTHYLPIFQDENYKNAIKFSFGDKKEYYQSNAKTIDNIQKGIIAVSKKEKPFDIFISYKETNQDGSRTKDSIEAQKLYEKLTLQGYKVFFSRITLEDKAGTQYEPYIYAALSSSKVMLTVCSSRENIESAWVKNEWSRFLTLRQKDPSKTLIPLYFDMSKENLPEEFSVLSSQNIKQDDFEQELLRGIKKLIPTPIVLKERKKKRNKILSRIGIVALLGIIIAVICSIPWLMKLPQYNAAMQLYYDKNYPEATWAFDAMGDYRDSEEMKSKCELSWRKSLASVAVDVDLSGSTNGSYYVTPNGTVETFDHDTRDANKNINIDENGKIVSISSDNPLYALHEDGYVDNIAENNQLSDISEWHNIVQISPIFNITNVALRSDGKLIYGNLTNKYSEEGGSDNWLSDISDWERIVSFDYAYDKTVERDFEKAAFAAVDADGFVHVAAYSCEGDKIEGIDTIENFQNVKDIDVAVGVGDNTLYINAVAITSDGKIISCIDGEYSEYDSDDIIDVEIGVEYDDDYNSQYFVCELHSDGTLCKNGSNKDLLTDVVYLNDGFVVTRSGSIYGGKYKSYKSGSDKLESTNVKTRVYDEWLERFN